MASYGKVSREADWWSPIHHSGTFPYANINVVNRLGGFTARQQQGDEN
jgi:hypothetical protein